MEDTKQTKKQTESKKLSSLDYEELNKHIEDLIKFEDEIKELSESIKTTREKIKDLRALTTQNKSFIENFLIENDINTYKYKDYKFGITNKKINKKPNVDEIQEIVYGEIVTKMEKPEAEKSTNTIITEIMNGGVENVKRVNIKKVKSDSESKKPRKIKNKK